MPGPGYRGRVCVLVAHTKLIVLVGADGFDCVCSIRLNGACVVLKLDGMCV